MEVVALAIALLASNLAWMVFYRGRESDHDQERHVLINAAMHPERSLPTKTEVPDDEQQRTAIVDDIGLVGTVQSNGDGEDE